MEPMNTTVLYTADRCEAWVPTQVAEAALAAVSEASGLPVTALRRRDEDGRIYDVTRAFIEEMLLHPFGAYNDLIDASSRIYDLDPHAPMAMEGRASTSRSGSTMTRSWKTRCTR
jgi:hypothetical protein